MTSFVDALNATPGKTNGAKCSVGQILRKVDKADLPKIIAAIADVDNVTASRIADALTAMGYPIGDHSVRYHRRGRCKCERKS